MNSREYWRKRELENLRKNLKTEEGYIKTINGYYDYMLDQIQKEINGFYTKYARKEGITIAEAKKRVSKLDMEAYERKAKRYVKDKNFSKEANEEMRLYNATMRINRLEMLKANIGLELVDGFDGLQKYFDKTLTERTLSEFERQAGILGKTIHNNQQAAHAIVNGSFSNATYSDRIWMYQDMMKAELSKLLQQGLIQGQNPRKLATHLQKLFGVSKENAERLMRTELARVQTEAQKQSFERNGFSQYVFVALGNACSDCKALDNGKPIDVKKMMPGENAPPIHPNCRCSVAAYEDNDDYEAWLDFLDKGGTTEEWNQLKNKSGSSIINLEDKGDLYTNLGSLSSNLQEQSLQVHTYLNSIGLPQSMWSGKTVVKTKDAMEKSYGIKKRTCDIWLREDAGVKTLIHEHLHARSASRYPGAYSEQRFLEEGIVEFYSEELCKREGVPYIPTYISRVNCLKRINKELAIGNTDYAFAEELYLIELPKREEWLRNKAKDYIKMNKASGNVKKNISILIDRACGIKKGTE